MRARLLAVLLLAGCRQVETDPVLDCDFEDATAEEILGSLRRSTGVNIIFNDRIAHVEPERRYTLHVRGRNLREIFRTLGWEVYERDGVILIEE